jgi:plasmid stabilization system protein ParE
MASISFLPAADQDYQEVLAWYQARSAQAAAGFEAAMEVALQRIADSPELSPLCDDRHRKPPGRPGVEPGGGTRTWIAAWWLRSRDASQPSAAQTNFVLPGMATGGTGSGPIS